jgi:hypothetical protein
MDTDYPLVRMTNNSTGLVYYGRTYNWSSAGIQTGNTPETTEFTLPDSLPPGAYSLVVAANGIASDPVQFNGPIWVDFNYSKSSPQLGTRANPYSTLAQGVGAVTSDRPIYIKPGTSAETLKISTPTRITAIDGQAIVGK